MARSLATLSGETIHTTPQKAVASVTHRLVQANAVRLVMGASLLLPM